MLSCKKFATLDSRSTSGFSLEIIWRKLFKFFFDWYKFNFYKHGKIQTDIVSPTGGTLARQYCKGRKKKIK